MTLKLTRFRIEALHNWHTIDVPIHDNKLILVGENGAGKSTVASFIYFFLTYQWSRLLAYDFKSILAVIDEEKIFFTKEELLSRITPKTRLARRMPLSLQQTLQRRIVASPELIHDKVYIEYIAQQYKLPLSTVMEYVLILEGYGDDSTENNNLHQIEQILTNIVKDQILYLPTYRRIEQDLKSIFGETTPDLYTRLEHWKHRPQNSNYIELIEFGMEDVENNINKKMKELGDSARDDLNKLTINYLRDVIRGDYRTVNALQISNLEEETIDAIFNRLDKTLLPEPEQEKLRNIIITIKETGSIHDDDKVAAHFLTRLIELYTKQQNEEQDIRNFVDVCNRYLTEKKLAYDNLNFTITIQQIKQQTKTIEMSMLSSGEKQIVSLFSHIYLSNCQGYFIIMDEPELSLSVNWQKRFLPDILATKKCSGLIAVTYSPFIFDNQLDSYAHSLEEFME